MVTSKQFHRLQWIVLAVVLVVAACGGQDDALTPDESGALPMASDSLVTTTESSNEAGEVDVSMTETHGADSDETPPVTNSDEPDGDAEQPMKTAPGGLLDQELAVLGADRGAVEDAIAKHGGEITVEVGATATFQVAFPVTSFDELLAIRKELEADGFQVTLVGTVDSP